MAYVTSLERISIKKGIKQGLEQGKRQGLEQGKQQGLEQGKQQGLQEGKQQGLEQGRLDQARDLVLVALEVRFGAVDPNARAKVQAIGDLDTLGALHRQAITAESLLEFVNGLESPGG